MSESFRILVVDDEDVVRDQLVSFLEKMGHLVTWFAAGAEALSSAHKEDYDQIIVEIRMRSMDGFVLLEELQALNPEACIMVITGGATMDAAIQALRLGASEFLTKPIRYEELTAAIEKSSRLQSMRHEQRRLRDQIGVLLHTGNIEEKLIGESDEIRRIRYQVELAASPNCRSVLITGETGTGKEVIARAIHQLRHEPSDPFIAINCPALPENLIESELFGHVRGAFTGATGDRLGAFELAHGGTLFLDEVADLSHAAQAKLLRVLETRTTTRVGASRARKVDVKVLTATNCDLDKQVEEGLFRSDLLFRINVFHVEISPLRERPKDILPLVYHFLAKQPHLARRTKELSAPVIKTLEGYDYPGNARELRNIIERAVVFAQGGTILPDHIMLPRRAIRRPKTETDVPIVAQQGPPKQEDEETLAALNEARWNRRKAAEKLGISYETLRWRIKKYGLR